MEDPSAGEGGESGENLINEEYRVWRKNSPLLYDWVKNYALEWPSLTVQWLPEVTPCATRESFNVHSLILGTHTSDANEPNYLMVAEVELPVLDAEVDMRTKEDGSSAFSLNQKLRVKTRILHDGEVNRARYMPQKSDWIATKSPSSAVYVFDHTKHGTYPVDTGTTAAQHTCLGHTMEGFGLAWNPHEEFQLLSGSNDSSICMWDLRQAHAQVQPLFKIDKAHTGAVEDVDWHKDDHIFGSCGDDSQVLLWDARTPTSPTHTIKNAHAGDVHCLAFNPISEFLLATGGADHQVTLWDQRNLKERVHIFEGHQDEVLQVSWAPFSDTILGSSSSDRRLIIWDVGRIGDEQTPEDAECGPPELLFSHAGHTARVSDFAWSGSDDWVIASIAEDNILQVWQMGSDIHSPEDEPELADDDLEEPASGDKDKAEPASKKQRPSDV